MNTVFSADLSLEPDSNTLTEVGILVVDEDPAFQLGLKTFLKEYVGFEKVFTARNGREAIDLINREESIELLTLDYQMPEMDGLELLTHLQEKAPRPLAVTMITGFPSEDLKREFARRTSSKLLTNHFLSKPVEFERLEPVILDCYEELKRSQQLTETLTGGLGDFEGEDAAVAVMAANRELLARFELLEKQLEANTKALHELRQSGASRAFWSGLFRLMILGVLVWMVWQSGMLKNGINQIKALPIFSGPAPASFSTNKGVLGSDQSAPLINDEKVPPLLPPVEKASNGANVPSETVPPTPAVTSEIQPE